MQGEYADGTLLKFWYDYLLAVPILVPAAYLTVRATFAMPWSGRVPRAARVVSILGTTFVLLIVLDRFGVETLVLNAQVYGYLSVIGAISAIVVGGIGTLMSSKSSESAVASIATPASSTGLEAGPVNTGTPMSSNGFHGKAADIGLPVSSLGIEDRARGKRGAGVLSAMVGGIGGLVARVKGARDTGSGTPDALALDMDSLMSDSTMVLTSVRGVAAWLVVRSGGETGSVMEIVGDRVTVGSSPDSGIRLSHPSAGETHALIRGRNGGYSLADLASRTGTWVNGRIQAGAILKDGSRISMGASELFFSKLGGDDPQTNGRSSTSDGVLLVRSGPAMGQTFQIEQGDLVIGRQPGERGARLDDSAVSGRHALLRSLPRGCLLFDLGSANGTKVDDVELDGVPLQNGDILKFGDAEVQFVHEESA